MNLHKRMQPSEYGRSQHPALLVFSHLRWHFVMQRPQHLLGRASQSRPVFFWEEPLLHDPSDSLFQSQAGGTLEFLGADGLPNVTVVRPHFRFGEDVEAGQRRLLDSFLRDERIARYDAWFYTPMALAFAAHLDPEVVVYDAMDELSAFAGAPAALLEHERELFRRADVVFTGGHSLFEHKRLQHDNIHAFPSSIEKKHFAQALAPQPDPADQGNIPHPRVGFYGVLDERFDRDLLREVAALRLQVHFVLLGPVVKIDPATLPQAENIHYIGGKSYGELPAYLAGWDAAMLPFALNESTRFISPTKTPEYLAAGKRVISTPIRDVVHDYGDAGLVEIAGTPQAFAEAIDRCLDAPHDPVHNARVDRKLGESSWGFDMGGHERAYRKCASGTRRFTQDSYGC